MIKDSGGKISTSNVRCMQKVDAPIPDFTRCKGIVVNSFQLLYHIYYMQMVNIYLVVSMLIMTSMVLIIIIKPLHQNLRR